MDQILVVTDDRNLGRFLSETLNRCNVQPTCLSSYAEVESWLNEQGNAHPWKVLTDYSLETTHTGADVIKLLIEDQRVTVQKYILMTGWDRKHAGVARLLEEYPDVIYLGKPFSPEQLWNTIGIKG